MIPQRKPHQSQLDYLWDNFAKLKQLELKDGQLIGTNEAGESNLSVDFTGELQVDNSELKLQVEENTKAIELLNDSKEGLANQVLEQVLQYVDDKVSELDVSQFKDQLDKNTSTLLVLNGTEEEEGSVLNIVTTHIESAFEWQEL